MATKTNSEELAYWVALNHVPNIGPVAFAQLLKQFKTAKAAWQASPKQLTSKGLSEKLVAALSQSKSQISPISLISQITQSGINPITLTHPNYPYLLKEIYDPPPVLYIKGSLGIASQKVIAIVGTRKMTSYGAIVTERLVEGLVQEGFTVVSGLARGVDAASHKATLTFGGKTIAVLGGGLANIYPPEHKALAHNIVQHGGAIISEFPPTHPAMPGNFPARNRIISGLSRGVIVVEAAEKSGTMITVAEALDQGREVFAVPGPITSQVSVGTMNLIKDGATLVTSVDDILQALNIQKRESVERKPAIDHATVSPTERKILELLTTEPVHTNDIMRRCNLSSKEVLSSLTLLELAGKVRQLEQGLWMVA